MKEIREGISEHIVSEKMRDILLLMLNRIEENSDSIDHLYNSEVSQKEMTDLKAKLADLLDMVAAAIAIITEAYGCEGGREVDGREGSPPSRRR